jgi:hypothetical protein
MNELLFMFIGATAGSGFTFMGLARWADSDAGRRRLALMRAEQRIRDAQTAAFTQMADMAEAAVFEAAGGSPARWPSDDVAGQAVELSPDDETRP